MSDRPYHAAAIAKAVENGNVSSEVEVMDYVAVASLAGVRLGRDGESPAGFFWRAVRQAVVGHLKRVESGAAQERERKEIEDQIRKSLSLTDVALYVNERGEMVVRRTR